VTYIKPTKRKNILSVCFFVVVENNKCEYIVNDNKMSTKKILFVLSSHAQFPNGHPTGWYLPEVYFKIFNFLKLILCYVNRQLIHIMY
jgi:hypothetical protein